MEFASQRSGVFVAMIVELYGQEVFGGNDILEHSDRAAVTAVYDEPREFRMFFDRSARRVNSPFSLAGA